ncbi:hypothetical protein ABFX02_04G172500 [Erythranthe guttata]
MNQMETKKTSTFIFFFFISFYVFLKSSLDRTTYYSSILPFVLAFLLAVMVVFAVRTTIVTWITVVVLLAFAGKRRRVLVREGRVITCDVAMYLVQVVLKEKSLVAFVCATIVSLFAMAWLRIANNISM